MRYDICSACVYFHPSLKTLEKNIPKHCSNPKLKGIFDVDTGFPTGIDIIHCDAFTQYPINYGDVKIVSSASDMNGVAYVLTQPRNFKLVRVPQLYDNSQNIKTIKL